MHSKSPTKHLKYVKQLLDNQPTIKGCWYNINKDQNKIKQPQCQIFCEQGGNNKFLIVFEGVKEQFGLPIHKDMQLKMYTADQQVYFQWKLQQRSPLRLGCKFEEKFMQGFRLLLCELQRIILGDLSASDQTLCQDITIPSDIDAKSQIFHSIVNSNNDGWYQTDKMFSPSKNQKKQQENKLKNSQQQLDMLLYRESKKPQNKFIHRGSLNQVTMNKTMNKIRLIEKDVALIIVEKQNYRFQMQVVDAYGTILRKAEINDKLITLFDTENAKLRWHQLNQSGAVTDQIDFNGVKSALMQFGKCISAIEKPKREKKTSPSQNKKINLYKSPSLSEISRKSVITVYETQQKQLYPAIDVNNYQQIRKTQKVQVDHNHKEIYKSLSQAKIHHFDLASLGTSIETLKLIDNDDNFSCISRLQLPNYGQRKLNIQKIGLFNQDTKALLLDSNQVIHTYDINTQTIQRNDITNQVNVTSFCPQFKLAETKNFKTFKAINNNSIFSIDPRVANAIVQNKTYKTDNFFNSISVDSNGRFACGSRTGQVRLYSEIGKNASCIFTDSVQPILHLESNQKGSLLLATCPQFLLLFPTLSLNNENMYSKRTTKDVRPQPITLKIKIQHLQLCKITNLRMIPAKFDENGQEKFIVSGFGEYVAIWNINEVLGGIVDNYKFTTSNHPVVQADFVYGNTKKLIITNNDQIRIKENK